MGKGWIKLHRKLADDPLWLSEPFTKGQAWVDLLMMVNHEDRKIIVRNNIITVRAGQRIISIEQLAHRWKWSRGKVRRFLKMLENDTSISTTCDRTNGTSITIEKWAFYQGERPSNGTTIDTSNGTSNGHQTDINKNDIRMNKEEKKCVVSAPTPTPSLEDVKAYCRERGFTHVDADKFWNFYESKNWMEGGQVIGWKQRLAYWEAKDIAGGEKQTSKKAIHDDDFWAELREKARKEDAEIAKRKRDGAG